MQTEDREDFLKMLALVFDNYSKNLSVEIGEFWWQLMHPFDLDAVRDALNRHCVNPDNGQFCPKPADVVKLIAGGTMDGALIAWSKLDRAMRTVGPYETVVFDDPIIHAVISDMGGWIEFGKCSDDDWPFKAKEFEARYRGYLTRGRLDHYPAKLPGIFDATNSPGGFASVAPTLIGNKSNAILVLNAGDIRTSLQITKLIEHKNENS